MAKQVINVGTSANDRKGDSLRVAFQKVNANFTELYNSLGEGGATDLSAVDRHVVPVTNSTYDLGSPTKQWRSLYVSSNTIYINNTPLSVDNQGNLLIDGAIYRGDVGPQGPQGIQGLQGETGPQGPVGPVTAFIFDGGAPSSVYSNGPAFDCGGVI